MRSKRVLFLTGLLVLSFSLLADIRIPYEKYVLPNGLEVILYVNRSTPVATVNIWYKVGSGREKPGRSGFAHLFEHLMFEGSKHVPKGKYDQLTEGIGGGNNGSTSNDRTNYWQIVPKNYLETALWLESDRMGFLLDGLDEEQLENQRAVVKNERRQSYENTPYGLADEKLFHAIYPPDFPYHWPVIGSMEDLSAAKIDDVKEFFHTYYAPNNAILCIGGDIDVRETKKFVNKYFGDLPRGKDPEKVTVRPPPLTAIKRLVYEDQVQVPRLYMAWITPPFFTPGDAELDVLGSVLSRGKNSRLYKTLVYDRKIAQDVFAYQDSKILSSEFYVVITAKPGVTLPEIEKAAFSEIKKIREEGVNERETQRAINQIAASFSYRLTRVGGFGSITDQLNAYNFYHNDPDWFNQDLARYTAIQPADVQKIAGEFLSKPYVMLSIVPKGKIRLAVK